MSWMRRAAGRVSEDSRRSKIAYLDGRLPRGSSVLVVGVSGGSSHAAENLLERWLFSERETTGLAYDEPEPGLTHRIVRGDARALPFKEDSFDYVVSNAVIEHVGGEAGARDMLAESRRVAKYGYFHTTPNRRFPVEVHTRIPILHWAPRRYQDTVFRALTKYSFPPERYWLFTPASARRLGPDVEIHRMGLLGMTFVIEGHQVASSRKGVVT